MTGFLAGAAARAALPGRSWPAAFGPVWLGLSGMPEPFGGQGGEGRVEFDAGELPPQGEGGNAGGAGAAERVEHHAARLAAGLDAPGRQLDRVRGEVRAPVGAGGDGPDVAGVAALRVRGIPATQAIPSRGNDLPAVRRRTWADACRQGAGRPAGAPAGGRAAVSRRRGLGGSARAAGWWRAARGWGRGRTSSGGI